LQLPIASAANQIVNEGASIDEMMAELFAPSTGRELADLM
jgi:hypothetical protein